MCVCGWRWHPQHAASCLLRHPQRKSAYQQQLDILVKYHAEVAIVVVIVTVVVVVIVTVVVVVVMLEEVGTVTVEQQQHQCGDSASPPFRLRYSTSVPYIPH